MDKNFSHTIRRRITCLSAASRRQVPSMQLKMQSNGENQNENNLVDFSTKNRSKELKRLSSALDIENVQKLKEILVTQRSKMKKDDAKAQYIDWLLLDEAGSKRSSSSRDRNPVNTVESKKNQRQRNNNMNDVSMTDGDSELTKRKMSKDPMMKGAIPTESTKKRKTVVRPVKPSLTASEDNDDDGDDIHVPVALDSTLLSDMHFKDMPIHPNTKRALEKVLKLQSMTEVQSKTFAAAVSGMDVLARARTGTGKTLAFLIPSLERLLTTTINYKPGKSVGILVISPTRELASQIGDQAEKLLSFHKDFTCQVMYGGTKMGRDVNALNKRLPSILVATPGRLLDHMENTKLSNGNKFGYDVMRGTQILILDEADRLLDMGFRAEIKKILKFLPVKDKRQTLLFSATVPDDLKSIIMEHMNKDFQEVDCIRNPNENSNSESHTNMLVEQTFAILPSFDKQVTAVVQLVTEEMKSDPKHKIVVFFPTARMVQYFAEFFNVGLGMDVIELHSKKSQSYRNKASDKFRQAKRGVLFTSDVSARGVDYPDVTRVIQVGLPESREQYIHRLGRTGRAGKEGEGILLLAPFETKFLKELKDIQITENKDVSNLITDSAIDADLSASVLKVLSRIKSGDAKLTTSAEQCYQSFIGYYKGQLKRTSLRSSQSLVDTANEFATLMGLKEQPGLTRRTVMKMGLKDVKNIRIVDDAEVRAKKRL